jgi:uncharacterized protein
MPITRRRAESSTGLEPRRIFGRALWFAASLLAFPSLGCAGHSAHTLEARAALDRGDPKLALELYNKELDVKSGKELPPVLKGDKVLFVLDRSLIQQALSEYKWSSRDLEVADKKLEMLDFSKSAIEDVGKYLFSDDTGEYRAPPYEKLLVNTMNMVNYLSVHDLSGAKVEARRLAVMQEYFRNQRNDAAAMLAPGSYLAGFAFEKSGRGDIAIRYYDEALQFGALPSLVEPVRRLVGETGYSGKYTGRFLQMADANGGGLGQKVAMEAPAQGELAPGVQPDELKPEAAIDAPTSPEVADGELLVIVNYGRVPAKVAKRIPIGLALTYASLWLSAAQVTQANQLAAKGLVMWVNYPELEPTRGEPRAPSVKIDGKFFPVEEALDVEGETRKAYEQEKGRIMASAITRLIARALAGEAVQAASNDDGVGLLLNLGTQIALTSMDTPDTRSWSTLPARIGLVRAKLPPGPHQVEIQANGARRVQTIQLVSGRWEAISLTALR